MERPSGVTGDELRAVRLFAGLDEPVLAEIAARGVTRAFRRRALLFRKGDPCRGLHVVLEGRVQIYTSAPDGREQVLHRIGARQAVTELPLFDGAPYPANARAVTDGRVFFLPASAVNDLCRAHPELLRVVIGDLGRSIRRLTQLVEKVSLKDVRARVATALLEQATASSALTDGASFEVPMTQEELAHGLAVTRESVARALAALRRGRVLEQQGRTVRILSVDQLVAVAEGTPARGRSAQRQRLGGYAVSLDGPCC